ncbi:sugar ABC transporter permease [Paenibacillus sp. PAMC21692]|uniref:ABC transporter permease n=1 Tax=Paenibacillus sp. PAMC21692 TaxID=2762320 RepID=UPI00164E9EC6|nr:ABC transporter permease subunit [Paenibacillus sp. PAMC21692]QNK57911.1 sugar ABC transporter permease [Paenibacillus sp. PAMC21692]
MKLNLLPVRAIKAGEIRRESFLKYMVKNKALYIMLLPGLLYLLIFKYIPMLGIVLAFQDYDIFEGIRRSPWVGLQWFEELFKYERFTRLIWNTLIISLYQLIFSFPAPIILACLLNELRLRSYKRVVQTILYLPHFLSWTIIFGLTYMLLSTRIGLVNQIVDYLGYEKIQFLLEPGYFRTLIVSTGIWKDMGWSSIIFLAALAGINLSLYEAAKIDGAGRWKQFLHVTLPGIMPAIVILLLLRIGNILDLGFEHIYVFLTPITYQVGDVLDTFQYRAGVVEGQYSFTTAIGVFKSVIGFILLVVANKASKKITGESLY